MTSNSSGGSTLQCGRQLWDDMPYWNSTPDFDFDHITAVDVSLSESDHPPAEKNDAMSIFKMVDLSHLGF